METVKVLGKGQIVIPAAIRKKYGIRPGMAIQIVEYDNILFLSPHSEDPVQQAMGCLPGQPSLTAELLEDRKRDKKN